MPVSTDGTPSRSCPAQKRKNFVSRARTTSLRSVVLSRPKPKRTRPCRAAPTGDDRAPGRLGPPPVCRLPGRWRSRRCPARSASTQEKARAPATKATGLRTPSQGPAMASAGTKKGKTQKESVQTRCRRCRVLRSRSAVWGRLPPCLCLPLVPGQASAGGRAPRRLASGVAPNCVLQRHTRRTGSGVRPNRPGETFSDSPDTRRFELVPSEDLQQAGSP